jgi:seryl-tRNA synthetase
LPGSTLGDDAFSGKIVKLPGEQKQQRRTSTFNKGAEPMADAKEQMTKAVEHLKQQRDELQLKLHLAKADAKDEWARLENQWEEIKPKLEAAREEAGNTAESVSTALGLAIDELKKGYERLKGRL